jgi:anti-sigma regulatory factor (Ser/Thr protein kinase)
MQTHQPPIIHKPPPNHHLARTQQATFRSTKDIANIRDHLEEWLDADTTLKSLRRFEILLATSELLTNAHEHGVGDCLFSACTLGEQLAVTVSNHVAGSTLPPKPPWHMPNEKSLTGRGLAIVDQLADSVHVQNNDASVSVTAVFSP